MCVCVCKVFLHCTVYIYICVYNTMGKPKLSI